MLNNIKIIAEVKTKSPFGYESKESWDDLFLLASQYGDMISIHTDPRWGGSFEILKHARTLTKKPILAKGIHADDEDIKRALDSGADYILVVGRIPDFAQNKCIVEPYSLEDLTKIPQNMHALWNSCDLKTGGLKTEKFAEARKLFSGWLCQASNIESVSDIEAGADAVLVGTHLRKFVQSLSFGV